MNQPMANQEGVRELLMKIASSSDTCPRENLRLWARQVLNALIDEKVISVRR